MDFKARSLSFEPAAPCVLIGEIGVNHNNDLDMLMRLIEEGTRAGFDVLKLQRFVAEEEISQFAPSAEYQAAGGDDGGQHLLGDPAGVELRLVHGPDHDLLLRRRLPREAGEKGRAGGQDRKSSKHSLPLIVRQQRQGRRTRPGRPAQDGPEPAVERHSWNLAHSPDGPRTASLAPVYHEPGHP